MADSFLRLLLEWIWDLFAAVERRDQYEEGSASDDEAEGSGCFVAFVIWLADLSAKM